MRHTAKAFTIIELLIVTAIIGILATLAMISLGPVRAKAKDGRRVSDIKQIRTALEMYKVNFGVYPSSSEFNIDQALSKDGYTVMHRVPGNPDKSAYGEVCTGDEYLYVPSGDTYKIYYCLGQRTGEVPAGKCLATPASMCEPDTGSSFGSGADGSVTLSSLSNLNAMMSNGRTCADAVSYRVTALTATTLSLNPVPPSTCLAVGDELFIINQQGIVSDYGNVGNYEIARVKQINGSQVILVSALTKTFGDPATQKINAQRIPQYQDLAVNATLSADSWNGSSGGLLVLKVAGILSGNGIIDMNAKGYRGSTAVAHPVNNSAGAGEGKIGPPSSYSYCGYRENLGGGGGGHGTPSWAPDGGGGGGHANIGGSGQTDHTAVGCSGGSATNGSIAGTCTFAGHFTNPILMIAGEGGVASGQPELSQLFFGGGGGAGGMEDYAGGWGDYGGTGGGIIYITAESISSSLIFRSNGQNAQQYSSGGGGGGGAGGSVYLKARSINVNSINATGGSYTLAGDTCAGGRGGNGSVGRLAVYYCDTFSGTANPTAYTNQISCN